jgi:rhodanese-related sulfurtransferase
MRQGQAIEIDIQEFAARRDRGVVVDVREPVEFVAGHVPGALLMPMVQLPARMAELDRRAPVFVICATGNRSQPMTELLCHAGYDAWSVAGGTAAWIDAGHPVQMGH